MTMRFFSVPVTGGGGEAEAELNRFLASHRVVAVDRQLVQAGAGSVWAVCVTHAEGVGGGVGGVDGAGAARSGRVDYREILPAAEFALFARLRALRKTLADRDGVPAYAVFTNEQLAAMVRNRARSAADLAAIAGIGKAKVEKYAVAFLEILRAPYAGPPGADPPAASGEAPEAPDDA